MAPSDDPTSGTQLPRSTYSTSQTVWLSEPKQAGIPLNPSIRIADVRQLSDNKASFTVSLQKLCLCTSTGALLGELLLHWLQIAITLRCHKCSWGLPDTACISYMSGTISLE